MSLDKVKQSISQDNQATFREEFKALCTKYNITDSLLLGNSQASQQDDFNVFGLVDGNISFLAQALAAIADKDPNFKALFQEAVNLAFAKKLQDLELLAKTEGKSN